MQDGQDSGRNSARDGIGDGASDVESVTRAVDAEAADTGAAGTSDKESTAGAAGAGEAATGAVGVGTGSAGTGSAGTGSAGTGSEPQETQLYAEKERIGRLSRIRQLVFGSLDGLLVPLGVVSGVAGGTGSAKAVIVAGIAESFAGALSMGAGEFISGRSEAQVHQTEINKELQEIRDAPEYELEEMGKLLEHEGVSPENAIRIANILVTYPEAYNKTMVEKELGLQMDPETVQVPEALTMSASYIVGSIFPLIAYFFLPVQKALPVSIGLTVVALVIVGIIKGKLASLNLVRSVLEIVVVGGASALGGYLLGTLIPRLFGY